MVKQNALSRVWDIIEKTRVGMLATRFEGGLRARPLEPRPDRDEGVIYFVTDVRGAKDDEIEAVPDVAFIIIDHEDKAYLSITGRAEVTRDDAKAMVIWKKTDDVWWPDGPSDPNVRVLRLVPECAELWDGPSNSAVAWFEFTKARVTGEKPNLGENRKVTVKMQ
jgi:general stress protein 26